MASTSLFDQIADEFLRATDRDVKTLRDVAERNPSLFTFVAREFLKRQQSASQSGSQQQLEGGDQPPAADGAMAVQAAFLASGRPLTIKDVMDATRMTRSAVRYILRGDKFRLTGTKIGRSELWEMVAADAGEENTVPDDGKISPTSAVIQWLEKHDEGTLAEIYADLKGAIRTTSDDEHNVISATLSNLVKQGRIRSQGDNGSKRFALAERRAMAELN